LIPFLIIIEWELKTTIPWYGFHCTAISWKNKIVLIAEMYKKIRKSMGGGGGRSGAFHIKYLCALNYLCAGVVLRAFLLSWKSASDMTILYLQLPNSYN
jgi:hypothetical protein